MRYNVDLWTMMLRLNVQSKELAKEFGISESYVSKLLHKPLDVFRSEELLGAIKRIGKKKLMQEKEIIEKRLGKINTELNAIDDEERS